MLRFISTAPVFLNGSATIFLTEKEKNLFEVLKKGLNNSELRVAGGWVRDKLLGMRSNDIDIALDNCKGTEAAKKLLKNVKDCSSTGIIKSNTEASKHLEAACIRIMGYNIDLVNLRSETYANTRIPQVKIGTPLEDAERRDLTINSLV